MTDINDLKQLIHSTVEIEGLLKVLLERDDIHAEEHLRDRFGEYSHAMNAFLQELAARRVSADAHLPLIKEEEAEEPQLKSEHEEADEAFGRAEEEVEQDMTDADETPDRLEEDVDRLQPGVVVESDSEAVRAAAEEESPAASSSAAPAAQPAPRRKMSIRGSLTLNDKFYFVRDVFGGNESDFNDTVDIIEDMDSYSEAEDYVLHDMMLDPNNFAVRQFLDFLAAHMNP